MNSRGTLSIEFLFKKRKQKIEEGKLLLEKDKGGGGGGGGGEKEEGSENENGGEENGNPKKKNNNKTVGIGDFFQKGGPAVDPFFSLSPPKNRSLGRAKKTLQPFNKYAKKNLFSLVLKRKPVVIRLPEEEEVWV
jgi:hypothetical protein